LADIKIEKAGFRHPALTIIILKNIILMEPYEEFKILKTFGI